MDLITDKNFNSRYDCIVVWNHGFNFLEDILSELRQTNNIEIVLIHHHSCRSMKKLVRNIYSYDYAPLAHLKSKIKYLNHLRPEAFFIFIKNIKPNIDYYGHGKFRHIESNVIRQFKEKIRALYNPKDIAGNLSHNHVIHATDNESQTDSILKLIGYKDGIRTLKNENEILSNPYHIKEPKKFSIKKIGFESLLCKNAIGKNNIHIMPLRDSVQFQSITNIDIYKKYIQKHRGKVLKDDYSTKKYLSMMNDFKYAHKTHPINFITVKNYKGKYLIQDGLHRAALELNTGRSSIMACIHE